MILRPYQADLKSEVKAAWAAGAKNVLMRLDTGGGKTAIVGDLHAEHQGASAIIAHRQELVGQLSMAMARYGVRHNLIAATAVRRAITANHIAEFGRSYFEPSSRHAVCGIDTLNRVEGFDHWFPQVTLWTVDEAHHVVDGNKWHKGLGKFTHPLCVGLGPTATPKRADGKGLGAHADGVFNAMVQGPPMRWLIDQGWLTPYRIVCPESDLQILEDVSASGDWSNKQLKEAAKRSHIVGDVVKAYQTFAPGKLGITFATDVETATSMAGAFRAAGIRAEVLTGETDDGYRRQIIKQLERREISMIVAVDIISEGFDLPAVDVAIMARPTQSLGLYMQQFGRALRPIFPKGFDPLMVTAAERVAAQALGGKTHALIIDMVANVIRHQGPPDKPRLWTLDRRDKRAPGAAGIPLRTCAGCFQPYERTHTACPYCGTPPPEPVSRSSPAAVDGDLAELDADTLARLRGDVVEADMDDAAYGALLMQKGVTSDLVYRSNLKRHAEMQLAQAGLRAAMEDFVRRRLAEGLKDRQIHKAFFLTFGIDVLSARALGRADAEQLTEKVRNHG